MDYPTAKRKARALLGQHGDVQHVAGSLFFPFRVGVWAEENKVRRFAAVGMGNSWEEALTEAAKNQKSAED